MSQVCLTENTDRKLSIPYQMYLPNQQHKLANSGEVVDNKFEHEFEYKINQYGFRYEEPTTTDVLLSVGCSITFGTGIPYEKTFSYLVSKKLGLGNVNVGLPGTGPEVQCVNAIWAINKYAPKAVIFYMSDTNRRILADEHSVLNFVPGYMNHVFPSERDKKAYMQMDITFNYTRIVQTAYQLYAVVELCREKNIPIYFKCWETFSHEQLMKYEFTKHTRPLSDINDLDRARDLMHQGIKSHDEYSQRILNAIKI